MASLCLHALFLAQVGVDSLWNTVGNTQATRVSPLQIRVRAEPVRQTDLASDSYAPPPTGSANGQQDAGDTDTQTESRRSLLQAHYFKADALTQRPAYLRDIAPQASALVPDVDPQPVIATLLINALGRVDEVILHHSVLSRQAQLFVSGWFTNIEFTPGMIGETPVHSQLTVEVRLDAILTLH